MISPVLPQHIVDKMSESDRKQLGKAGRTTQEINTKIKDRAEKDLHKEIINYLRLSRIPFSHARMDRKSNMTAGWPDFSFCFLGYFVAWEAKTGTKLSKEQLDIRSQIERHGGEYRVITDLSQATAHIQEMRAADLADFNKHLKTL